jgi:hypothetical protein
MERPASGNADAASITLGFRSSQDKTDGPPEVRDVRIAQLRN